MKPVLIFSGANDRAVIAFCRYAENAKINYAIVANGEEDLIFSSDYNTKVIATRRKNELTLKTFLEFTSLCKVMFFTKELFVLPSTEYLNRFLLKNNEKIIAERISFGLCNKHLYTLISDKFGFGNLCEKFQIPVPTVYSKRPDSFPYVVKPKTYFSTNENVNSKPVLIYSKQQEKEFLSHVDLDEVYYQEYIGGKSIYLLFYFYKNKTYSVFSQENYVQQDNGESMIFCKSANYHSNDSLIDKYVQLFIDQNFHGLVMIEIKYYRNEYFMIEANPRLWGPSQLILDSKMTLFDDFAQDNNLIYNNVFRNDYKTGVTYFWSGGLVETKKKNVEPMFYDIDKEYFFQHYSIINKNEVYNRKDTVKIYLKENQ